MSVKKPSIGDVPKPNQDRFQFDNALKQTVEAITGRKNNRIIKLDDSATTSQIIAKVNELIDLLM